LTVFFKRVFPIPLPTVENTDALRRCPQTFRDYPRRPIAEKAKSRKVFWTLRDFPEFFPGAEGEMQTPSNPYIANILKSKKKLNQIDPF
jgi:hypothetical protein